MRKSIQTDPEGFTLPGDERYLWADVEVVLDLKATVKCKDGKEVILEGHVEGSDVAELFVDILNSTAGPLEPLQ